jgi:hypothetical protein
MSDYQRPKKPYQVVPETTQKPFKKTKNVIIPAKNNANNKILYDCIKADGLVKLSINNLLCSDEYLAGSYTGKIKQFDDFTILIETLTGSYLINKSSITLIEFLI